MNGVDEVELNGFTFRVVEAALIQGEVQRLVECDRCRVIVLESQVEQHVALHPAEEDPVEEQLAQMAEMSMMHVKLPKEPKEVDPIKQMLIEKACSIRDYIAETRGECCTEDVYLELLKVCPDEMRLYDKRWIGFLFRGPIWQKNGKVVRGMTKHPMSYWERA